MILKYIIVFLICNLNTRFIKDKTNIEKRQLIEDEGLLFIKKTLPADYRLSLSFIDLDKIKKLKINRNKDKIKMLKNVYFKYFEYFNMLYYLNPNLTLTELFKIIVYTFVYIKNIKEIFQKKIQNNNNILVNVVDNFDEVLKNNINDIKKEDINSLCSDLINEEKRLESINDIDIYKEIILFTIKSDLKLKYLYENTKKYFKLDKFKEGELNKIWLEIEYYNLKMYNLYN